MGRSVAQKYPRDPGASLLRRTASRAGLLLTAACLASYGPVRAVEPAVITIYPAQSTPTIPLPEVSCRLIPVEPAHFIRVLCCFQRSQSGAWESIGPCQRGVHRP